MSDLPSQHDKNGYHTNGEMHSAVHVPDTGPFNETTTALLGLGTFGTIGFFLGRIIGRLGDDWKKSRHDTFATLGQWFGAASFGLLAASVAIRQSRESKAQAELLAKHSAEVELKNEALAAALSKAPLIEAEKTLADTQGAPTLKTHEMNHQGQVFAQQSLEKSQ